MGKIEAFRMIFRLAADFAGSRRGLDGFFAFWRGLAGILRALKGQ